LLIKAKSNQASFNIEQANQFWLDQKHYDKEISLLHSRNLVRWVRHRLQERTLKAAIQKYKPQSLLEVGCGTGRLFHLYRTIPARKVGVDLNPIQLAHAKNRAVKYHVELREMSAYDLQFQDDEFDCLVYAEVLLHIPPEGIGKAISESSRVAQRLILVVDSYWNDLTEAELEEVRRGAARHCFVYKYSELFQEQGLSVRI